MLLLVSELNVNHRHHHLNYKKEIIFARCCSCLACNKDNYKKDNCNKDNCKKDNCNKDNFHQMVLRGFRGEWSVGGGSVGLS